MVNSNSLDNALSLLRQGLRALELAEDSDKIQRVMLYVELLLQWNKAYNLTAADTAEEIIVRHVLDSLTVLPLIKGLCVLDVGSGAGFPGVILAIFLPEVSIITLDSNNKKTRFLTQVKVALKLSNLSVVHERIEAFSREGIDMIISRAFSSLEDFVKNTRHLQQKDRTRWIAMKGKYPEEELNVLPTDIQREVHTVISPLDLAERHIIILW